MADPLERLQPAVADRYRLERELGGAGSDRAIKAPWIVPGEAHLATAERAVPGSSGSGSG
jgi:hypothetical protein